ncbi:ribonuclease H-like domain-containing protein [Tanacetum coccineum]
MRVLKPPNANVVDIDCDDTFSLVVKPTTKRAVYNLALSCGWHVHQLDVKNAFLNGDITKTAHRAWFQQFASYALSVGYSSSRCDSSLFIYCHGIEVAYLWIYVDDIVLTASSISLLQRIISSLHREFEMTDLGALNYFLGISVTRDSTGDPVLDPTLYRSLAGGLQYLTFTRPDISYAVQQICLYMHDPREPHLADLKRLLRYAGCPSTLRSTSGYCIFLGDNLLYWSSKRQHTLSRSSAEAEYQGVANVVAETAWIHNLLQELHSLLLSATLVYYDNVSAIYLTVNHVQNQRKKHIEIDIHFVCDMVTWGQVRVLHVPSCYQYADIFTKGLPLALFEEFHTSLSVRSPAAQTTGEC